MWFVPVVAQFEFRHPEQVAFAAKDLGEPRDAPRLLRRIIRAFGSLPHQIQN